MPTKIVFEDGTTIYGEVPQNGVKDLNPKDQSSLNAGAEREYILSEISRPESELDKMIQSLVPDFLNLNYRPLGPRSNGCGSGWNEILIPDLFPECCNQHDIAYGTLGITKDIADFNFLKCNVNVALKSSEPMDMLFLAFAYYAGVRIPFAETAYKEAQGEAKADLRLSSPSVLQDSFERKQTRSLLP